MATTDWKPKPFSDVGIYTESRVAGNAAAEFAPEINAGQGVVDRIVFPPKICSKRDSRER
jgi:hypothetical protein